MKLWFARCMFFKTKEKPPESEEGGEHYRKLVSCHKNQLERISGQVFSQEAK
jgi:hypothetical protein